MKHFACPLVTALLAALPELRLVNRRERDWFSATFAGVRMVLTFETDQPIAPERLSSCLEVLAELPVARSGRFVADMCLAECENGAEGVQKIGIEALLLDE
ncbi:hypothetical protein [Sphingorhabdus sp.]|jgi:hypothetical protein|uniref:hypothetical protein n=1 Tax=Sphingorhabdus sp. TaxID=1902408 RepID=UPI003BB1A132|nr:hypothetical protein [Sphingomonadales bacterium]MBL0021955.1 hypothetical protein [Sphingomonadales bacterium]